MTRLTKHAPPTTPPTTPGALWVRHASSLCIAVVLALTSLQLHAANYLNRAEYKAFSAKMIRDHGFSAKELNHLFAEVKPQQHIIDAMNKPAEGLAWHRYRPIFLKQARIDGGVTFWNKHAKLLNDVEQRYGVPPEIIVAIIGVETRFGQYTGKHRVIDAVATLGFDYPKRGAFFTSELEQFLLLSRDEKLKPLEIYGSYAGAMGMPQFISSSYRNYAVDFNNNGRRDLFNEPEDIMGSVGNYFARHGWKPGEAVARRAHVTSAAAALSIDDDRKPPYTVKKLAEAGTNYAGPALPSSQAADLLRLEGKSAKEYWLTLTNFYVITRYNHSPLYAMAVWQLGEEIRRKRAGLTTSAQHRSLPNIKVPLVTGLGKQPSLSLVRYQNSSR